MGPHLIWAGVVLVLGVLLIRQWRYNNRRWLDARDDNARLKQAQDLLRSDLHALEAKQRLTSEWIAEATKQGDKEEARLSQLEQLVKALAAVPKGPVLGRRV